MSPSTRWFGALAVGATLTAGCSDWKPIRNANDYAGYGANVERAGKETVHLDELVTCDASGFVIAAEQGDCEADPPRTFDTRRDRVLVHEKDTRETVGVIIVGVLTSMAVAAATVAGTVLSGH